MLNIAENPEDSTHNCSHYTNTGLQVPNAFYPKVEKAV
jgi:hypothetical protein